MTGPLIEFKEVTKRFGDLTVLDRVNLSIFEGEITTVIGKSGVGKSVLLKHIIGLLEPDEGCILFKGQPVTRMNRKHRDAFMGQISYMFQNNALFDSMTVYDNIAMPLRYERSRKRDIHERVMEQLRRTELEDAKDKFPAELSGGMQKRVALARALITRPNIVLFDEPTTGQDPIRKNAILGMIAKYQRQYRFTAVLISHDLPDVSFISNRILAIYEGKVIFQGTPEMFDDFDHPFRREFIRSLESLEEELNGLYSRAHFKFRYQMELHPNHQPETFAVAVFCLQEMDDIIDKLGHLTCQNLIQNMVAFINRHFSEIGAFSTRYDIDRYVTVMPYSEQSEAAQMIQSFAADFIQNGISHLNEQIQAAGTCNSQVHIELFSGLTQGKPQTELSEIIAEAEQHQEKIAEFDIYCRR
jgi:phospholipid/cholesterol/gamma-HCH transport system ATP-binding protein